MLSSTITPGPFRSCASAPRGRCAEIQRIGVLSAYNVEAIVEDAMWLGPGANLRIWLPAEVGAANAAWLARLAKRLGRRGITLSVELDGGAAPPSGETVH